MPIFNNYTARARDVKAKAITRALTQQVRLVAHSGQIASMNDNVVAQLIARADTFDYATISLNEILKNAEIKSDETTTHGICFGGKVGDFFVGSLLENDGYVVDGTVNGKSDFDNITYKTVCPGNTELNSLGYTLNQWLVEPNATVCNDNDEDGLCSENGADPDDDDACNPNICVTTVAIAGYEIMDSNMNQGTMTESSSLATDGSQKWCYNDVLSYCSSYGGLYTWDAAMSLCPSGYHLPTVEELNVVISAASNNYTNLFSLGFNPKRNGFRAPNGNYQLLNAHWNLWTSSGSSNKNHAWSSYNNINMGANVTTYGFGVRCFKD